MTGRAALKNSLRRTASAWIRRALRLGSRPYSPAGAALVIAPHPDDEILGCGGLIAARARAGQPVEVIFLTDGEASHRGHPSLGPAELGRLRRGEAQAALAALGLGAGRAHHLGLPDGSLERLPPVAAEAARREIAGHISQLGAGEVFVPFLGGGSSEHDAAARLAAEAAARAGLVRLLEYPVWAWWNPLRLRARLGRRSGNFRLDLGELRALKRAALACHRTQLEASPPWTEPVLPAVLAAACCGPEEFFFARQTAARQRA